MVHFKCAIVILLSIGFHVVPLSLSVNEKGESKVESQPSKRDAIYWLGPPPKKGPPSFTSGWGSFYSYKPEESSEEEDNGWGWYVTTYNPSTPKKKYGWGWAWVPLYPKEETDFGWGWGTDEYKPPTGKWSHRERPWRPGWSSKVPCCSSNKPYFSPSYGPAGPGYPYLAKGWLKSSRPME